MNRKKSNKHRGSKFDSFLEEEGLYAEASVEASKRTIAWQINEAMKAISISKTEMARRMNTSRASLDRLLDPDNSSVTLLTLYRAAQALGKRVHFELVV